MTSTSTTPSKSLLPTATNLIPPLNDMLRKTGMGGQTVLTRSVSNLPTEELVAVLRAVAAFDDFTDDNDPYGEHDYASLDVAGHRIIWKIDYYNHGLAGHSPDPADTSQTTRTLTIMLGEDY